MKYFLLLFAFLTFHACGCHSHYIYDCRKYTRYESLKGAEELRKWICSTQRIWHDITYCLELFRGRFEPTASIECVYLDRQIRAGSMNYIAGSFGCKTSITCPSSGYLLMTISNTKCSNGGVTNCVKTALRDNGVASQDGRGGKGFYVTQTSARQDQLYGDQPGRSATRSSQRHYGIGGNRETSRPTNKPKITRESEIDKAVSEQKITRGKKTENSTSEKGKVIISRGGKVEKIVTRKQAGGDDSRDQSARRAKPLTTMIPNHKHVSLTTKGLRTTKTTKSSVRRTAKMATTVTTVATKITARNTKTTKSRAREQTTTTTTTKTTTTREKTTSTSIEATEATRTATRKATTTGTKTKATTTVKRKATTTIAKTKATTTVKRKATTAIAKTKATTTVKRKATTAIAKTKATTTVKRKATTAIAKTKATTTVKRKATTTIPKTKATTMKATTKARATPEVTTVVEDLPPESESTSTATRMSTMQERRKERFEGVSNDLNLSTPADTADNPKEILNRQRKIKLEHNASETTTQPLEGSQKPSFIQNSTQTQPASTEDLEFDEYAEETPRNKKKGRKIKKEDQEPKLKSEPLLSPESKAMVGIIVGGLAFVIIGSILFWYSSRKNHMNKSSRDSKDSVTLSKTDAFTDQDDQSKSSDTAHTVEVLNLGQYRKKKHTFRYHK